jgi:hypothetical protein
MLFDPERHEALAAAPWSEARAREAILRIARTAAAGFTDAGLWPIHPNDLADVPGAREPFRMLYFGAAGVMWALDSLHRAGVAPEPPDFAQARAAMLEDNRRLIRLFVPRTGSWLMGDAGILLLAWKHTREPALADQLAAVISGNRDDPSRELMWGASGTMVAALALHEWTGEARWAELFRASAAELWKALERDAQTGVLLWTQDLYGTRSKLLGAVHGFAGNLAPILRGRALLAPEDLERWRRCAVETLSRTALREDGLANWLPSVGEPEPGGEKLLVQQCHGAPGVVNCVAGFPSPELDALLLEAGELTWRAGPLRKGSNLCHGTAGNGYAFLKLFRRTGDERWLERARRFAMHAIGQCERQQQALGCAHHSLWTGDLGLALYLRGCIVADAAFPTVDCF